MFCRAVQLTRLVTLASTCVLCCVLCEPATAQTITLQCDPAQTTAHFALSATLHTVHGEFAFKRGEISFDPATEKISGEIVFDAISGESGNKSRDKTMHKEVLESGRYPEITFQPDRVDGRVAPTGVSTVQVHGVFRIHGMNHELRVPVELHLDAQRWSASTRFTIPYVSWGMKRPSAPFVRVAESVDIEFHGVGALHPAAP